MTLSEYEQRALDGIETGCCADDPGFAMRLDLNAVQQRRRRVVAAARSAIWLGWLVLVIGAGMARGPVSIGFLVACYGLAMIVTGTVTWIRNRGPRITRQPGSAGPDRG
jgi:hypothetical protein